MTESLKLAKPSAQSSVLILLVLSATFETVHGGTLLLTVSALGISGLGIKWLLSGGVDFLVSLGEGRYQKTHNLTPHTNYGPV